MTTETTIARTSRRFGYDWTNSATRDHRFVLPDTIAPTESRRSVKSALAAAADARDLNRKLNCYWADAFYYDGKRITGYYDPSYRHQTTCPTCHGDSLDCEHCWGSGAIDDKSTPDGAWIQGTGNLFDLLDMFGQATVRLADDNLGTRRGMGSAQ